LSPLYTPALQRTGKTIRECSVFLLLNKKNVLKIWVKKKGVRLQGEGGEEGKKGGANPLLTWGGLSNRGKGEKIVNTSRV